MSHVSDFQLATRAANPAPDTMSNERTFIDLFAGCGGLSLGLMSAGWHGIFAVEHNPDAFNTLKHNLIEQGEHNKEKPRFDWPNWLEKKPFEIKGFIRKNRNRLEQLSGEIGLVAGGPPCQGFSFAGGRTGNDPRNELFLCQLEVVDILQPRIVLMENVQGIGTAFGVSRKQGQKQRGRPKQSYAKRIRAMLQKHGYKVQQHILKAADFGVPQLRPRYFTLGIRQDLLREIIDLDLREVLESIRVDFLKQRRLPLHRPVTVSEAISDLTTMGKRLVDCEDKESPPGFLEMVYEGPITSYQYLMHGDMNSRGPNSLRLVRHRPETITRFEKILSTCRKGVSLSKNDRVRFNIKKTAITPLSPDLPSKTLTTLPDDLLHYAEPRVHTVREHARFQSFPDWYEFCGKYTTGGNRRTHECPRYTQVGNAVPPLLAEAIGEALNIIYSQLEIGQNSCDSVSKKNHCKV